MTNKSTTVVLGAIVLGLGLAACGGGDGDGEAEPPIEESTRFAFYDWERNVIPNPDAAQGRETETPFVRLEDAVRLSQKAPGCGQDGCIVVSDESLGGGYFVLMDRPELTAADIVDPEATSFPPSDEPAIAFGFTEAGKDRFQELTSRVASRAPGKGPEDADHFAVVYGEAILSRPIVDPSANPNGIDGENGATIAGGFSSEQVDELVAFLEASGAE